MYGLQLSSSCISYCRSVYDRSALLLLLVNVVKVSYSCGQCDGCGWNVLVSIYPLCSRASLYERNCVITRPIMIFIYC
jgi:hypothetical protein